jgi:hypothetical protein
MLGVKSNLIIGAAKADWLLLLPLLGCLCASAGGQLVTVDGGQGMAGEPSGGIVGVNFGNWTVEGSLGVYNGAIVGGAAAEVQLKQRWRLKAGDQNIEVGIPTQTDFSSEVFACGASLSYSPNPATRIRLFGGMAGSGYASPSVLFFTPQIPLGALSVDHYLDPKKRYLLFARALFSNQQTILGGLLYQAKRLQTGFAVGTGSNQPHAEALLNYKDDQWDIRSGYRYSGNKFQLLTMPQFRYAQEDRENADVRWSPWKQASFTLERHEYLEPVATGAVNGSAVRGSMDMAGGDLSVHGMGLGVNVFESRFTGIYASAASFYASQRLTRMVNLSANYYRPLHSSKPMPMLAINAMENLNRRVRLAQFATHVNGQWTVNYGGGLRWDRFDVNFGYATFFAPLAAGGGRFKQQMNLSGHVNLGRWQFSVQTYVQPDGSLLYGYEVRSFYFHPMASGNVQAPQSHGAAGLSNFLIEGQVRLEDMGKPVADVPIRIGDETVYADETGVFSLRVAHKHAYKMQLLLERQIGSHYYEQVSGPTEVMAGTDAAPGRAQFVVRVNQKKVPSLPKGGIVIGNANAAPDGATGSGHGSGGADGPA